MPNKRVYDNSYLNFGFSSILDKGIIRPQCVVCKTTLSKESLRPSKLKLHLNKMHPLLANKGIEYFRMKERGLKRARLDNTSTSTFCPNKNITEASYEIALIIAKKKKPHTIGESLVKPYMLEAARLVLDQKSVDKLSQISLSDSTIKSRIDEMSNDIKMQVTDQIRLSPFFSIQLDESTDVSNLSQLLVYARYICDNQIKEEFLFCKVLTTTTKAIDVMSMVSEFFVEEKISWDKLIGVCTDGAPSMLGSKSGFVSLVKRKNPEIIATHCIIHRQALASKTLPSELNCILNIIIKVVNYIKGSSLRTRLFRKLCGEMYANHQDLLFYTAVRWLSKGNVIDRVFELFSEIKMFISEQSNKTQEDLKDFDEEILPSIAYLADIFERLNYLNRQLQGKETTIIMHTDAIKSFIDKLDLWTGKIERNNISPFHRLNEEMNNDKLPDILKNCILQHLTELKSEFERYFPDIISEDIAMKLSRNPFNCNVDDLPNEIQEEFLDFRNDTEVNI